MKRKREASNRATASEAEADADEPAKTVLPLAAFSGDVCDALTARYGRSAAPQHRHLLASAVAIRSILLDDGLPLTPSSYLPAAVSALCAAGPADPAAASALASLLAILLPHLPSSLPHASASTSASALADFLSSPDASQLPTGAVRSVVKSLGHLALHLDAADWDAVATPLEALLAASVDRRPKVRKCAQGCLEKLFACLESSGCGKKASNAAIGMFEGHISSVRSLANLDSDPSEGKEMEAIHRLSAVAIVVPYLSKKARKRVLLEAYPLLGPCFSLLTRHVLRLMEILLEHLKAKDIESEMESLISALVAYLPYDEKKPDDTIVTALLLMKNCLLNFANHPNLWMEALPAAFKAVSGYLVLDKKPSEDIAKLLGECIDTHIDRKVLLTNGAQLCNGADILGDGAAIKSICLSLDNILRTCGSPSDSILAVISVLFFKLGVDSYFFMKDILLTLADFVMKLNKESQLKHVQECIGSAVIAMGPEKILSLIPIAFDGEGLTCSNTWLIPIFDKYIYGASLQLFVEYIVPLAQSIQNACSGVKKAQKCEGLQSCVDGLWNLLPAFCRYPMDISENFCSLSKLLVEMMKCDRCLYKPVVKALQQLADGTIRLTSGDQDLQIPEELSAIFSAKSSDFNCKNIVWGSKKDAHKNMKVLASHSADLMCTFADYFPDSSPEKRADLKDALKCLAPFSGVSNIHNLFLALLKRFGLEDGPIESDNLECQTNEVNGKEEDNVTQELNTKRCLLMELIPTFSEAADQDLLDLFFGYIKSSLNSGGSCASKALFALSAILKEHDGYCLAQLDEIMVLLHGIKSDLDNAILEGQLLCYQYLLIHMIKVNEENISKKAFLILNELILALKSKKESRRLAYDVLLAISTSLRSCGNNADSDLQRLFTMVMGYLSSPSPHIVSGAIAALSLLIYSDANFCLEVPNLIPSVLVLLQHKAIEVIKASLGFVKVLVTSLRPGKLLNLQADIMSGILPWSSVTKHHFKGKVALILEILIRKCGFDVVDSITPEKYKAFVKSVEEGRKGNRNSADLAESEAQEPGGPGQHTSKRRKKVDSNAGTGQEKRRGGPTPKDLGSGKKRGKDFRFKKGTGKSGPWTAKSQQSRTIDGGNKTNYKFKSKAQPGNSRTNQDKKSRGGRKRMGGAKFNKTK